MTRILKLFVELTNSEMLRRAITRKSGKKFPARVPLFVNNEFVESSSKETSGKVVNPWTGEILSETPQMTAGEFLNAVKTSEEG